MILQSSKLSVLLLSAAALTVASLLLLCPASAHAQGGVPLWTNRYDNGFSDLANAIAVDSSGNVFVTGGSRRNDSNYDYATIKYSNAGVPLWTNRYNGPGDGDYSASAITVDDSGNVFVTGGSDEMVGNGEYAHENATIAYSNSGVPLWTNRYGGGAAAAIAVDSNGNVFVTGYSEGYATIAYSNSGVPLWTNRYHQFFDIATAIAVDNTGNVLVTGYSFGGPTWNYATVAYSNSGVPLWTNRYNGPVNHGDHATAIAVDGSGNVVTGESENEVVSGYSSSYATIKYSNAGVPLWTNRYDGPANLSDRATAIAVDAAGNVFVTGWSSDVPCCPGSAALETIAYSNVGDLIWEDRYYGPDNQAIDPRAIAVDRAGNVFVTGYSYNGTYPDYVTIKYSSSLPPPVHLDFQLLNNQLVLSWTNTGFSLQTAPAVTGPFTNFPAATSPYTHPLTAPQQFFRLIAN